MVNSKYIKTVFDCKTGKQSNIEMTAEEKKQYDKDIEEGKLTYIDKRKNEYPSIEECVHAILDGKLEDIQLMRDEIKNKYPKN